MILLFITSNNPIPEHPGTSINQSQSRMKFKPRNSLFLLPPRMLMIKLPLRTVHPLRAWAAVTESTVFCPIHTLGQRPAQGVQFNLRHRTQGHMYTNPNNERKSFIHAANRTRKQRKQWKYDEVFLFSLTCGQKCGIKTIMNCPCQGRGSCCAKRRRCFAAVTSRGRPRVQSEMNETFSQTCQRRNLITDCFCGCIGPDELFVFCSFRSARSCEATSRIFVWQLQELWI